MRAGPRGCGRWPGMRTGRRTRVRLDPQASEAGAHNTGQPACPPGKPDGSTRGQEEFVSTIDWMRAGSSGLSSMSGSCRTRSKAWRVRLRDARGRSRRGRGVPSRQETPAKSATLEPWRHAAPGDRNPKEVSFTALAGPHARSAMMPSDARGSVANVAHVGSLSSGKVIADRHGRHERWGRLAKAAGNAHELSDARPS